jgi:putative proteasome-type protease
MGNSGHGKTLSNRVLRSDSLMKRALKAGFLSFDSTRYSANDVGFPIAVVFYKKDSFEMQENRFTSKDMGKISQL